MDAAHRDAVTQDDLSALAWVHDELRRSLEAAHKSMRRFLRDSESTFDSDVDVVEPAVLRNARQQLHQGVGALELVGLPAAATLLRASESALQRFTVKSHKLDLGAVEIIEQASFALLDFVARRLAGKPVPALALFPQYRAVQMLVGAERIHPADLWHFDWHWRDLPLEPGVAARPCDAAARVELETRLLAAMRGDASASIALSQLAAALAAGADDRHMRALWQLAAAFFEVQSQGLLKTDVYSKRVASRVLAQARACERGGVEVSERLARDLLFFCAQAAQPPVGIRVARLDAVRRQHGLLGVEPVDYEVARLGRFDPALIVQARKRVAGAKDAWSAVAGGELHRFAGLVEQFSLVGDSLQRLHNGGEVLAEALHGAVTQTVVSEAAPPPALAMEVATAMLYLEASLEGAEFDHPEQAGRVRRLAERIAQTRSSDRAGPLEPWMEELYRRVSDRQTMGSVVQELRASLSESEKLIDQFFRKPDDRNVLIPVPSQFAAMRGVLSVLGMEQASHAVLRMRDEIDALIAQRASDATSAAEGGRFERLAGNLGALGFLIDMLGVQPQLAKSLFVYDPAQGTLNPVMGRTTMPSGFGAMPEAAAPTVEPRLIEQALSLAVSAANGDVPLADLTRDLERISLGAQMADHGGFSQAVSDAQRSLANAAETADAAEISAARDQLAEALTDFVATASEPVAPAPEVAPVAVPTPAGTATGLEEDDEMREVFLEEAREVIGGAYDAIVALTDAADDIEQLTSVRRAFHTLKGSSRMVGLGDFGEAAWSCEQLYNARLADAPRADETLLAFTTQALGYLGDWVEALAARRVGGHQSAAVRAAADILRIESRRVPLSLPGSAPLRPHDESIDRLPLTFGAALPAGLPRAADLRLGVAPAPAAESAFELDLRALDTPAAASAPPQALAAAAELAVDVDGETEDTEIEATRPLPLLQEAIEVAPRLPESVEMIDLDLPLEEPPASEPATAEPPMPEADQAKVVGPLRISIPLFNIYLNEADELSRRLATEVAEWALELHRPIGDAPVALAHSLAGSSATVGFGELSQLARSLEHALMRANEIGHGAPDEARLFVDAAEDIRRLLHQFAAGFLKSPAPGLMERLAAHEVDAARRIEALAAGAPESAAEAAMLDDDEPAEVHAFEIPTGSDALPEAEEASAVVAAEPLAAEARVAEAPAVAAPAAWPPERLSTFAALGQAELKTFRALPEPVGPVLHASADAPDDADDIDAVDAVDADLFPIFEEEGQELLPQLAARMRDWQRRPSDAAGPSGCMRTLHTLKGGARLAGAMRLGEMAHRLETAIEHLLARGAVEAPAVEALQGRVDALMANFEALRQRDAAAYAQATAQADAAPPALAPVEEVQPALQAEPLDVAPPVVPPAPVPEASQAARAASTEIDWSRFELAPASSATSATALLPERRGADRPGSGSSAAVRVRAPLLERLVNHAGEVSITRSRIESEVATLRGSLGDLNDNLERLRAQLRDIELQAETQISSRMEAARAASQSFDPLEMDRFTRFQELTRMMAESVNDVATVQRALTKTLQSAEDELAAQARLTRDMQDDLLRTRMVEFEGQSDRLYRVVRLAAKETGKQVRLDIVGGSIEIDRGVLERMTAAFEHLLRNCVTHGIEAPEARTALGKDATGAIMVAVSHEGNEVAVEFRDDGAGLNLPKIRERAVAMGLLERDATPSEAELANLIFHAGVSTADSITELAGRGVGMDVVRAEVNSMGGRIETATAAGKGTSFKLVLPLTTAVTQVVMMRCGDVTLAVPSTLIEIVRRAKPEELAQAYASGIYLAGERALPFFWLGALLQSSPRGLESGRTLPVIVIRSAQQRIALHADEVLGNQEVVVKNLGPQLSKLPGLAGMTLLASGVVALIYNPVALATLYGDAARAYTRASLVAPQRDEATAAEADSASPLVMVVDDSLTVRRVTQRLLVREGYRVVVAKDGLEALEKLAEERPAVLLSDIEMPRMDGFDLARNVRSDARLASLPIIMITSRIAQKHRDVAAELGVDHYLGKPYSEEDLLALVARYTAAAVTA